MAKRGRPRKYPPPAGPGTDAQGGEGEAAAGEAEELTGKSGRGSKRKPGRSGAFYYMPKSKIEAVIAEIEAEIATVRNQLEFLERQRDRLRSTIGGE